MYKRLHDTIIVEAFFARGSFYLFDIVLVFVVMCLMGFG